jgi:5-methylthioadenosine/S-adenosylhomocysteine deaminase
VDAEGKVALPGLVNSHTHVPMTLFRGLAEDQPLNSWLRNSIWPLEAKLKPQDIFHGALLGCLEMMQGGITCFADMYFYEDKVAESAIKSGLRAVLAEGIIETGDKTKDQDAVNRARRLFSRYKGSARGNISVMFGPHSAYSCSQKLLAQIAQEAFRLNASVHTHMAESHELFKNQKGRYGLGEVEFLEKLGFFKPNVLAAHCIDLSEKDMRILAKNRVNVVHAPVSNMKLGLGVAKVKSLADLDVNVCLGTDGAASSNSLDMFETMKVAALLQKLSYHDPAVLSAYEVLKMATINGAKALNLEKDIGSIEEGKKADIVLLDISKPHSKPLHNIYASIVYSSRASDVDTVIVDGKILMENGRVETLDEQTVMQNAEKTAYDLQSR